MDMKSLYKLCVANLKWVTKDSETLKRQCKQMEEAYRQEWLEKEALLDQVIQIEEDWWQRRELVLEAEAKTRIANKGEESAALEDTQDNANGSQVTAASLSQLTD